MTILVALGSFVGFVTSVAGYFFAGFGLLTALAIYLGTPVALLLIAVLVRMLFPASAQKPELALATE